MGCTVIEMITAEVTETTGGGVAMAISCSWLWHYMGLRTRKKTSVHVIACYSWVLMVFTCYLWYIAGYLLGIYGINSLYIPIHAVRLVSTFFRAGLSRHWAQLSQRDAP